MSPNPGPRNPWLADSSHAIGHGRCDQQDNDPIAGPAGPGGDLRGTDQVQYSWLGSGHFGGLTSGLYDDGGRVIWTNGREQIAKLDYDTLEVLATFDLVETPTSLEERKNGLAGLDTLDGKEALDHAIGLALTHMTGIDGVYSLLDADHRLFVGRKQYVVAYAETDPADRHSPIVEAARWDPPPEVTGLFVGMNITFDGWLVVTTDEGWVVALSRDFSDYRTLQLPGAAEEAAAFNTRIDRPGFTWVRTSICTGDDGGVYVSSVDHTHKIIWTGDALSLDPDHGAWRAEYRNGAGLGSGTTPCLMGFDDEDRFVVIGDGDDVVNITLFWRDEIPDDWEQLPGAPSRRIAGMGAANMGNPDATAVQTEQSITVSGYGAMTVNNEPASIPDGYPDRGVRLLVFFLGHKPEFTPHGMHKFAWDPLSRQFAEAWVNREVSSPNSVPFVSQTSDLVYTCGCRDSQWTIEAVDWTTGDARGHWILGGSQFNSLGAGVTLDEHGRIVYGNTFGKTRLLV